MENIDTIKQIDIKQLIEKETNLKFKKNTLESCPFCKSGAKDSAFSVNVNKNIFKCFSCEKKGNPIEFIKLYKKVSDSEAVKYLADKHTNLPKFVPVPEIKTDFSKSIYAIQQNSKQPATEYLQSRNIETDKLPKESYFYDSYKKAVVFIDSTQMLINKRIISPVDGGPKSLMTKDSILNNSIYDKTFDSKQNTVYIVEGVINALSLFPLSSITIFSTNNKFTDVKKLSIYLKNKDVVLAFDNDVKKELNRNPGKECTEYYNKFITQNITVKSLSSLILPENTDVNNLLTKNKLTHYVSNTDNYDYLQIDILDKPLIKNNSNISKYFKIEDSYYTVKRNDNDMEISDCIFEFLYRLKDENGTRLIKVQQTQINNDSSYRMELLELPSKSLKKESFEDELSKHGFNFYGSSLTLSHIKECLSHKEKTAKIIDVFGWQPKEKMFVFSNSAISSKCEILAPNSIGMITDKNEAFYLKTASPTNVDKYEDLKKFKYQQGNIDFKEFAELFYDSNNTSGSVGIQFYILALFRDVVFKTLDFFPYLYLYGEPGGGKTSYVDILLGLFGDESTGLPLKSSTQAALAREGLLKRNTISYYKEYKKDVPNYVDDYLKTGYDGVSRKIGNGIGKDVITFEVQTAGVIDSNFLPTNDTAIFDRMIILDFDKSYYTEIETTAHLKLKNEIENGLCQVTKELLQYRDFFEDNFKDVFYSVLDNLKKKGIKEKFKHERTIKHMALILTPFHLLESKIKFPYNIENLEQIIISHTTAQNEKLNSFDPLNMFWQSLAFYKMEGNIFEYNDNIGKLKSHYIKMPKGTNGGLIFLKTSKMTEFFTYFAKFCRLQGIENNKIDSMVEIKNKLLSKGYEPYVQIKEDSLRGKNQFHIGYSHEFRYTTSNNSDVILINGQEVDL